MKKRALIVTVGTGTRPDVQIFKPLKKAIEHYRPDFVCLAASVASRPNAEIIVRELALAPEVHSIAMLRDIDDFQAVFQDINAVFQVLFARGYAPDEIEIDFTSGTKAMSSGAVLAAIHNQCGAINYITGVRENGVVKDGTEQFRQIPPTMVFAAYDLKLAREFILKLRFDTAEHLLSKTSLSMLAGPAQELGQQLKRIAGGYRLWDLFNHKGAMAEFKNLQGAVSVCRTLFPTQAMRTALEKLAPGETAPKDLKLIDLYNNAERRAIEGRYDDAVARLYRIAELLAQYILERDFAINTGDVDIDKTPTDLRTDLERLRDRRDNKVKIGMDWGYRLLSALDHPAGLCYTKNDSMQGQLRQRNQSILAHGLTPMTASSYNNLKKSITELVITNVTEFDSRAHDLQFPWLAQHTEDLGS